MPGTYSQIYIQCVFAVKGRQNLLQKEWRDDVFKYMSGIIKSNGQKPIIVNGVEDHVHLFIGLRPVMNLSDIVRDVKNNSTRFIKEQGYVKGRFAWQEGYAAFSYSQSHINRVYRYIANQEAHHRKQSFKDEYLEFLKRFEVDYNEAYLFDWIDIPSNEPHNPDNYDTPSGLLAFNAE